MPNRLTEVRVRKIDLVDLPAIGRKITLFKGANVSKADAPRAVEEVIGTLLVTDKDFEKALRRLGATDLEPVERATLLEVARGKIIELQDEEDKEREAAAAAEDGGKDEEEMAKMESVSILKSWTERTLKQSDHVVVKSVPATFGELGRELRLALRRSIAKAHPGWTSAEVTRALTKSAAGGAAYELECGALADLPVHEAWSKLAKEYEDYGAHLVTRILREEA